MPKINSGNRKCFLSFQKYIYMAKKKKPTVKDLLADVGPKVAKYRFDKKLSMDQLAEKSGVSVPFISGLEKNQSSNISLNKLIDVCEAIEHDILLSITSK